MNDHDTLAAMPPAGDRFVRAIDRVLVHEGGDADDPRDAGGRTRWGISQRTYPTLDIRRLTRADAIALYRRDFWTPLQGDALLHRAFIGKLIRMHARNDGAVAVCQVIGIHIKRHGQVKQLKVVLLHINSYMCRASGAYVCGSRHKPHQNLHE